MEGREEGRREGKQEHTGHRHRHCTRTPTPHDHDLASLGPSAWFSRTSLTRTRGLQCAICDRAVGERPVRRRTENPIEALPQLKLKSPRSLLASLTLRAASPRTMPAAGARSTNQPPPCIQTDNNNLQQPPVHPHQLTSPKSHSLFVVQQLLQATHPKGDQRVVTTTFQHAPSTPNNVHMDTDHA